MASNHALATRYAKALFELAVEKKAIEPIETDIFALQTLVAESKEFSRILLSPVLSRSAAESTVVAVAKALKLQSLTEQFLLTLAKNRRLPAIAQIAAQFLTLARQHRGEVEVVAVTAEELSKKQVGDIEKTLKATLKKDVVLVTRTDKELIGGLVLKVGSVMLDGSIKGKLERVRAVSREALANL